MNIGYIGLGALGSELAKRFLDQHKLYVWDLDPDALKRFETLGARAVSNAAEIAEHCDVILTCLPRSSDVHEMIFGAQGLAGGLRPGTLIIDQTSGIPEQTRAMATHLEKRGVLMMDAAVSASPQIVSQGLTTLMVSGPDTSYEKALPILQAITKTIYRCGARVGDGQAMKMVNNAMNGACRMGTLEIVALGRKLGLPLNVLSRVLNQGSAHNQTTEKMLPAIEQGRQSTNFSLALMLKDVNQAVALGLSTRTPLPVVAVTRGLMLMGLNQLGPAARLEDMICVIQSMAGTWIAPQEEPVPQVSADSARSVERVGYLHGRVARPDVAFPVDTFAIGAGVDSFVRDCDALLVDLDDAETADCFLGQSPLVSALPPGLLLIHIGAGAPASLRALQQALAPRGVAVADSPLRPDLSHAAKACQPFGCPPEHAGTVQAVLALVNSETVYCGPAGTAREAALVRDGIAAMCLAIALECVAAGYKYGLSLRDMATVLNRGSGWSAASRMLLGALTENRVLASDSPASSLHSLALLTTMAIQCGAPIMSLDAARSQLEAAVNRASSDIGGEALVQHYESAAQTRLT